MELKPDERTMIDPIAPARGWTVQEPRRAVINPPNLVPARDRRFSMSERLGAKIETIARARTRIGRYVELQAQRELWSSEEHLTILAYSVNASSEIEGEQVSVELVPLILSEATTPLDGFNRSPELDHRLNVLRQIRRAYLWALETPGKEMVSPQFIKEAHQRMFGGSGHYARMAGMYKTREVVVAGTSYHLETLAPHRVEEAVERLCNRTNRDFGRSKSGRDKPLLTIIAEFILDFLAIHPFEDGNGRLARLLSTYLLERIGYHFAPIYPLDAIVNERRADYFAALFEAQRNWYTREEDITPWVEFYVDAVFEQWERALRIILRAEEAAEGRSQDALDETFPGSRSFARDD